MATRASRLPGSDRQRGQATVEWIGSLAVVALVIGVLLVTVPSLAPTVSRGAQCLVARVLQVHNGACASSSPKPSNQVVCQTTSQTNIADDQVSVFFVNVGHNQTLIKTTFSNGEVQYTLVNTGEAQLQADLLSIQGQAGSVGFDINASAAGGGQLQGSHTWTFPNAAAAQSFANQVNGAGGVGTVLHDAAGPFGGLLDVVGIHGAPDASSLAPGNLTYSYKAAGLVGQLNGNADFGLGGAANAQLDAELKAAGGARLITSSKPTDLNPQSGQGALKKGDVQLFVNLSGNANAALQAQLFGPSATGSAKGSATATVTLGPDGSLQQVQITATGDVTGQAGLQGKTPKGEGELQKALNLNVNDGGGVGYQYTGTLNLANNPAAKQALVSLLNPGGSVAAIQQLAHQFDTQGSQRLQPYTLTRSQGGGGFKLEIVDVGGGAKATVSKQNQSFSPGYIKPVGGGWQQVVCQK